MDKHTQKLLAAAQLSITPPISVLKRQLGHHSFEMTTQYFKEQKPSSQTSVPPLEK